MEIKRKFLGLSGIQWAAIGAISTIASLLFGIFVYLTNNENSKVAEKFQRKSTDSIIIKRNETNPSRLFPSNFETSPSESIESMINYYPQKSSIPPKKEKLPIEPIITRITDTTIIRGTVKDLDNLLIKNAEIILNYNNARTRTTTDSYGYFEIKLPGKVKKVLLYVIKKGYADKTELRTITDGQQIVVLLEK